MYTRQQAIDLTRKLLDNLPYSVKPSYYSEPFMPHEWVIEAIIEASKGDYGILPRKHGPTKL